MDESEDLGTFSRGLKFQLQNSIYKYHLSLFGRRIQGTPEISGVFSGIEEPIEETKQKEHEQDEGRLKMFSVT